MRRTVITTLFTTLPLAALIACQGDRVAEDTAQQQPAAEETMEMAAATFEIEVSNPMPHAMVVYRTTSSGEVKLGTVPANGSTYFTITEPADMNVPLRAEDEAQTHSVTGSVHLMKGMEASWTIGAEQTSGEMESEQMKSDEMGSEDEGNMTPEKTEGSDG